MTFLDLLDTLDQRGVRLSLNDAGRLHTSAPKGAITAELALEIRANHDYLVWTVVGRASGHTWVPCTRCGKVVLLLAAPRLTGKTVWPSCRLTPGCPGRHTTTEATP